MKLFGHPIHQILIVFPVGLLVTSVIFELIALSSGSAQFWTVSYWLIAGGLIGGVIAAVFGVLDWRNVPSQTRAHSIGIIHGLGNATVLALFAASWWIRPAPDQAPSATALMLSILGAALLFVTGWLGGELVARLSVGVDEEANVNASNSAFEHGIVQSKTSYRDAA